MSIKSLPLAATALGLISLSPGFAAPKPKETEADTDALAKQVVEQFMKALVAKDVDGVLATADLPFHVPHVGLLRDRAALRGRFVEQFKDKDYGRAQPVVVETKLYSDLAPKLRKESKESLDQVMGPRDRVVIVTDATEKGDTRTGIAVRVRDGKAKIVGFFN